MDTCRVIEVGNERFKIIDISANLKVGMTQSRVFYMPLCIFDVDTDTFERVTFKYIERFVKKNIEQLKLMDTMKKVAMNIDKHQLEDIIRSIDI